MNPTDGSLRESRLLRHIYAANGALPPVVTIPPGDDMGAVRLDDPEILVTVDQLIQNVHFRLDDTPLELIGRKAMTRNLSDVAAMAALPLAAVVAVALPDGFTEAQANTLFDAMRKTGEQYACPLIGGDISVHRGPLTLTVTVLARAAGIKPILRSGAKPGDLIAVTGRLGKAWCKEHGGGDHLTFEPRISLARKLVQLPGIAVNSMIDLSDGLAGDLREICRQSRVGAEIMSDRIPLRQGASTLDALQNGEDYELLFTYRPDNQTQLPDRIEGVMVTTIGKTLDGERVMLTDSHGVSRELSINGWEHRAT